MASTCGVCNKICDSEADGVKCVECEASFHLSCKKITTRGAKKEWSCDKCKSDKAKSSSSVSSNKSTSSSGTPLTKEFLVSMMESFKKDVFGELKTYGKKLEEFTVSQQFLSDAVDKIISCSDEISKRLATLEKENSELRNDNFKLRTEMNSLRVKFNNLEQYSRKTNVEISGIPQTKGEDVITIVQDIGKVIGAEVRPEEVMAAHRVPAYNRGRTPQIVVQFQNRMQRSDFLDKFKIARKSNNEMTANQVNKNFRNVPFYVNEHLTPENKILLSKVKARCKDVGYKYAWCKEGKIFARRTDDDSAIRIECEDDLVKIK